MELIEFIESYRRVESDYQWNDNHGELIRCINCKKYNPNGGDNAYKGYCSMLGSYGVPRDGYCAWAQKREDGEEYPQVVKGAFPQ